MRIYGHRGDTSVVTRENSMTAFRKARDRGVGIETDLRTDRNGTVILFHDRCLGGRVVSDMTREEIVQQAGFDVPTLAEFLDEDWDVPVNFDVKTMTAFDRALPLLRKGDAERFLITAFDHSIAHWAAHLGFEAGMLTASAPHAGGAWPKVEARLKTIVWHYDMVDLDVLDRSRSLGFDAIVYGPTTRGEHVQLCMMGVDGVITDHIEHALWAADNTPAR